MFLMNQFNNKTKSSHFYSVRLFVLLDAGRGGFNKKRLTEAFESEQTVCGGRAADGSLVFVFKQTGSRRQNKSL